MTTAALYDIHGNLPALETVLAELDRLDVEQVVVGGDVALGPMPRECLDLLHGLGRPTHFVRGNCETSVRLARDGDESGPRFSDGVRNAVAWTAQQLDHRHIRWMASWPATVTLELPSLGEVLFCHATPRDENEIFTRETHEEHLLPIFDAVSARVVVCGHTHMQFDRRIGAVRVLNAGSVGMPFGRPGPHWLLFDPEPRLQHTELDLREACERIRATDYPAAGEFAHDVSSPAAEREMVERFGKAEVGSG